MQSLVTPVEAEAWLCRHLPPTLGTVVPEPVPLKLAPPAVGVTALGGVADTPVSYSHDVSVDCWAWTPAEALALAARAAAAVSALALAGGRCRSAAAHAPYMNPDPQRPTLCRATFAATLTLRGDPYET